MIKFPYALTNFYDIITEGYFYVDRTSRIRMIEEAGKPLLFLRPRRFGKSLLLSMLENYYDVRKADEFEKLFGHLAIGQNPTPLHNQYLVMKWDFSAVASDGDLQQIRQTLHDHINGSIEQFIVHYRDILDYQILLHPTNALRSFQSVLAAMQTVSYKLYLLIDEYDNFANTVMMSGQSDSKPRYEALVQGEGLLKTAFKAVKSAMTGLGVDRVFITGVSPVVMSDITSGFNIAENISLEPEFNDLCGFNESEILPVMLKIASACQLSQDNYAEALASMRTFYDGYSFTRHSNAHVFNSTSVIYFLKYWQKYCEPPEEMLDDNLALDNAKLSYISSLSGGNKILLNAFEETRSLSVPKLSTRFGLKEMLSAKKSDELLASLLYYFGVLTLDGRDKAGKRLLKIPNMVVQGLYVERIRQMLLPDLDDRKEGKWAAEQLYTKGEMAPLCHFIEQHYFKVFDNRDSLLLNELTIKTAFLTLLFNDHFYLMGSETEVERGYADLTMIVRPQMRSYPNLLDILIEFKSVKLGEAKSKGKLTGKEARQLSRDEIKALDKVEENLKEAKEQAQAYGQVLSSKHGSALRLRKYVVVALGFDRLVWEEVKEPIIAEDGSRAEAADEKENQP